jgi:hypothetical protein
VAFRFLALWLAAQLRSLAWCLPHLDSGAVEAPRCCAWRVAAPVIGSLCRRGWYDVGVMRSIPRIAGASLFYDEGRATSCGPVMMMVPYPRPIPTTYVRAATATVTILVAMTRMA